MLMTHNIGKSTGEATAEVNRKEKTNCLRLANHGNSWKLTESRRPGRL